MRKNLKELFNSPYYYSDTDESFISFISISVFVLIFMIISQVDIIDDFSFRYYIIVCFLYSFISFIVPYLISITVSKVISKKAKRRWSLKLELVLILSYLTIVSLFNIVLAKVLFNITLDFLLLITIYLITVIIGAIPISFILLLKQQKTIKANLNDALDFNKKLHKTTIESNILYVEAEKNYLFIYYSNGKNRKIRSTLKDWLNNDEAKHCIRVHRGFAVSINQIETVEGNSQGLRLTINNCNTTIPVSRKYIPIVRNYLTNIP